MPMYADDEIEKLIARKDKIIYDLKIIILDWTQQYEPDQLKSSCEKLGIPLEDL